MTVVFFTLNLLNWRMLDEKNMIYFLFDKMPIVLPTFFFIYIWLIWFLFVFLGKKSCLTRRYEQQCFDICSKQRKQIIAYEPIKYGWSKIYRRKSWCHRLFTGFSFFLKSKKNKKKIFFRKSIPIQVYHQEERHVAKWLHLSQKQIFQRMMMWNF